MSRTGDSFFPKQRWIPPYSKELRFQYKAAVFHLVYGAAHRPVPTMDEWVAGMRLAFPDREFK